MAFARPIVIAVMISASVPTTPAPSNCEVWTINGYRIGMTLEEARAVRKAKESIGTRHRDGGVFYVSDPRFTGRLYVTRDNTIVRWTAHYPEVNYWEVKLALVERFGNSQRQDVLGRWEDPINGGTRNGWSSWWQSESCNSAVELVKFVEKGSLGEIERVQLTLYHLSLSTVFIEEQTERGRSVIE